MKENADKIDVLTFGCRLNTYESEVMRSHAKDADVGESVIINTCAVTAEAERQARQAIRKAKKNNPSAKIIVTGCAVQVNPDAFKAMPEVDQIIGNDVKLKREAWAPTAEKIQLNDIMSVRETASHLIEGMDGHARAFLQVQNGCDHRCTFCIIPYGRGNSRSVPVDDIVAQVRRLVDNGYNEIVFTGVDVTSYGPDLDADLRLGAMIKTVMREVPDLKRLRLSSLDPVEMDDDLWELIADEPRLMPHLHMSLQAGDDMVLKRMKRRHLRNDAIAMCERARSLRPDIVFGADIIAGFPTETDEMFQNTYDLVEECNLTFLHIFPYSARNGTPAAKMPQVEMAVRKERAARLRELGTQQVQKFLQREVGQERQLVIENDQTGRSEHFAQAKLDGEHKVGSLVRAKITGIDGDKLTAITL
jgi:threonylcarbamoyladenosine tRNA methylthiotransferase MtaB